VRRGRGGEAVAHGARRVALRDGEQLRQRARRHQHRLRVREQRQHLGAETRVRACCGLCHRLSGGREARSLARGGHRADGAQQRGQLRGRLRRERRRGRRLLRRRRRRRRGRLRRGCWHGRCRGRHGGRHRGLGRRGGCRERSHLP